MIVGVSCSCAAAPNLFRQFLFANHVANYMRVPLFKGEEGRTWAEKNKLSDLLAYINSHGSFVVVVGWTSKKDLKWVDINNADSERSIRAEMLLEQFANKNAS